MKVPIYIYSKEETDLHPPTCFTSNAFTKPFLEMDSVYNVPKYKEINASFFSIAFFPFMFGLMFGDVGHGTLLFIFAIYLFKTKFNESLYNYRWLLLLMGFFSIYCGLVYNEFFAVPLVFQNSCYRFENNKIFRKYNCVYHFGIDHAWSNAENENLFLNSYKMKLSILFGFFHMMLGLSMNGLNMLYFHHFLDFFIEFLPKLVFMTSIFGYLCFCIIYKWF